MAPTHASGQAREGIRLVFTDLDGCLFSTLRKQPHPAGCLAVAVTEEGKTSGWQSAGQAALFEWLGQFGALVPVTARTAAGLARVRLPLGEHAIWAHGAGVRLQGEEDADWRARSLCILEPLRPLWGVLADRLTEELDAGWSGGVARARIKPIDDPGFGVIGLDLFGAHIEEEAGWMGEEAAGLGAVRCCTQADRITFLPEALRKEHAVAHAMARLQPALTVGVGDSLSDLPFLALCDQVVMPGASQAMRRILQQFPEGICP